VRNTVRVRERHLLRTLLIAVAAGIAFGAAVRISRHASTPIPKIGALGVPWLALGFAMGALERDRRRAALAAAIALVTAVGTYYFSQWFIEGRSTFGYAFRMGVLWSLGAALAGAAFGMLGSAWRARVGSTIAVAVISGAFVGEALLLLGTWRSDAAQVVLGCELVVGVVLPFLLARRRQIAPALALTVVAALSVIATEAAIRSAMHAAGWAGG
jgi:hypothetical protein